LAVPSTGGGTTIVPTGGNRAEIVRRVQKLLEQTDNLTTELQNAEDFWKRTAKRLIKHKRLVRGDIIK
jgi:hypothetical protein